MAEQQSPVPIVEHLPNGENPHPSLEGAPEGSLGHAGAHLEHEPITDGKTVIAAPVGHNVQIEVPGEKEANDEAMLKENPEKAERWDAGVLKRLRLKKAA